MTFGQPLSGQWAKSSPFNAPRDYSAYGGKADDRHEGVDVAPVSAAVAYVLAVADGVVEAVKRGAGYGNYVIVRSEYAGRTFRTWRAHMASTSVTEGQTVRKGDRLGVCGSSGNSSGRHDHLTMTAAGGLSGYIIPDVVDPTPYYPAPPLVGGIDLLPYLRGDGRSYRVGNAQGGSEVFQTQVEGDRFYQAKAWGDLSVVNWEEFIVTDTHIGRDVDTSPGGGRYYRQSVDGRPGAPWVKRRMVIGESFSQTKRVQFYRLDNCEPVALHSGVVTDSITLVEHLSEWRSPFGVVVPDVVVLRWEQGGELYHFARGYGLVGWSRAHQDPNSPAWSAIAEMRPDVGRLARLRINCL